MNYISIENVSYKYKNSSANAVDNISLEVKQDDLILLTGGNGSGKSTLVRLLMKEFLSDSGKIYIEGKEINNFKISEIGNKIGYVLQEPSKMFFNTTVYEEITCGLKIQHRTDYEFKGIAEKYLEMFSLASCRDKLPYKLSEGQKQLVALSAVLAMDNEFFILDEPTTGLDRENKAKLIMELKQKNKEGKGIIVVSHDNHLLDDLGGREVFMSKGRIIEISQCNNY